MQPTRTEVTNLLSAAQGGSESAASDLFAIVYDELRAMARAHMAREPAGHTLQPTALVHEAFLRLVGPDGDDAKPEQPWGDRSYFFAAAGQAMRRILVERARRLATLKRGASPQRVTLDSSCLRSDAEPVALDVLDIHRALDELEARNPELAEVAQLRFFVGLKNAEVAEILGTSGRTTERRWTAARAFLLSRLES